MPTTEYTPGGNGLRKSANRAPSADKPFVPLPPPYDILSYLPHWSTEVFKADLTENGRHVLYKDKPKRLLSFRAGKHIPDFHPSKSHALAAVVATRGTQNDIPCGSCQTGLSPFEVCCSYRPESGNLGQFLSNGACNGCISKNQGGDCEWNAITGAYSMEEHVMSSIAASNRHLEFIERHAAFLEERKARERHEREQQSQCEQLEQAERQPQRRSSSPTVPGNWTVTLDSIQKISLGEGFGLTYKGSIRQLPGLLEEAMDIWSEIVDEFSVKENKNRRKVLSGAPRRDPSSLRGSPLKPMCQGTTDLDTPTCRPHRGGQGSKPGSYRPFGQ